MFGPKTTLELRTYTDTAAKTPDRVFSSTARLKGVLLPMLGIERTVQYGKITVQASHRFILNDEPVAPLIVEKNKFVDTLLNVFYDIILVQRNKKGETEYILLERT